MFTDPKELYRLKPVDIRIAGRILAKIFLNEPQIDYFIPDKTQRKKLLTPFYGFLVRYGMRYGRVYAPSPMLEGIAVWLPPKYCEMTLWRILRAGGAALLFKAGLPMLLKLRHSLEHVSNLHKQIHKIPHWYLFLLGVKTRLQGRGYASLLINPILKRIDQENKPCYLETQNQKNVELYQRYGFEVIDKIIIPGSNLSFWGMLRKSQKPA